MTYKESDLSDARVLLSLIRLKGTKNRRALELLQSTSNEESHPTPKEHFLSIARKFSGPLTTHDLVWQQIGRHLERTSNAGIQVLPFHSPDYPERLRYIDDPPVVLFAKGAIEALHAPASVAIVGTREPTTLGECAAEKAGLLAAEAGVTVVSGLALGCDTKAHEGCINAHGIGIAVLANALNRVYPAANSGLADQLLEHSGCLVNENPVGTKLSRWDFAYRDRLQSGLSDRVMMIDPGCERRYDAHCQILPPTAPSPRLHQPSNAVSISQQDPRKPEVDQ